MQSALHYPQDAISTTLPPRMQLAPHYPQDATSTTLTALAWGLIHNCHFQVCKNYKPCRESSLRVFSNMQCLNMTPNTQILWFTALLELWAELLPFWSCCSSLFFCTCVLLPAEKEIESVRIFVLHFLPPCMPHVLSALLVVPSVLSSLLLSFLPLFSPSLPLIFPLLPLPSSPFVQSVPHTPHIPSPFHVLCLIPNLPHHFLSPLLAQQASIHIIATVHSKSPLLKDTHTHTHTHTHIHTHTQHTHRCIQTHKHSYLLVYTAP